MADTIRVKSNLIVPIRIAEPHPDASRPGDSPVLKQADLRPGVNEGVDGGLFKAWADAHPDFVASKDDLNAGTLDGKVYEMTDDEPEAEYGFEVALKRASEGDNAKAASEGSTIKDRPVTAEDQRTGSADPVVPMPVTAAAGGAAVKTPLNDANLAQGKPAADAKK